MMEKKKRIIICQGDKSELEEITGEKYEYLKPCDIIPFTGNKYGVALTFAQHYVENNPAFFTTESELLFGIKKRCRKIGADAVIHYTTNVCFNGDQVIGYAKGTFVKLAKRKSYNGN